MSMKVETTVPLPWQSLKSFTASATLSEKVWRVANNLLFAAAGLVFMLSVVEQSVKLHLRCPMQVMLSWL